MPIMTYCISKQLFFSNLLYGFVLMIIVNQSQISQCRFLKAQCHEIFKTFFCLKDSTWAPYEQAKTVSQTFQFSQRYSIAKLKNRVFVQTTTSRTQVFSQISSRKTKNFAKPLLPVHMEQIYQWTASIQFTVEEDHSKQAE